MKAHANRSGTVTLGIDPGTQRVGYGVVQGTGSTMRLLAAGILEITTRDQIKTLQEIKKGVDALIAKFHPAVMGIEKLYFSKNQTTAMAVSQARGVILLSALEKKVPVREYTPNEVKLGVTGYGLADKKAILKMVRLILGEHELEIIDDASDALALAIIASNSKIISS